MVEIAQPMQPASDNFSLGTLVGEYAPRTVGRFFSLVVGFLMGVGGVFGMLYGATGSQLKSDDRVPLLLIGAFVVLIGWAMIESWLRGQGLKVQVYSEGLVRSQNGRHLVCRWDEIATLLQQITKRYYNGVYTGTTHVYTVLKSDGKKLTFNDTLKNVEKLGNLLQEEVTKRHLPRAIAQYNSGGTVNFGKLSLSPTAGLGWGDKSLPWAEIQGVQINKGYLSVKKQGKWLNWAKIPVAQIPNLLVALTLIDRIVGLNTKK